MTVEAHVVTIANASAANDCGLLNPFLEKFKDGALTSRIFGVPAVQAGRYCCPAAKASNLRGSFLLATACSN